MAEKQQIDIDLSGIDVADSSNVDTGIDIDLEGIELDLGDLNLEDTQTPTEPEKSDYGAIEGSIRAIPSGLLRGINTILKAGAVADIIPDSIPDKIDEWADDLFTSDESFGKGIIGAGIEQTIMSFTAGLPGGLIGSFGSPAGAVAGFAASAGVLFSAAEYYDFMKQIEKEAKAAGATDEEVAVLQKELRGKAIISALAEGGFEALSDLIQGKLVFLAAKGLIRGGIKDIIVNTLKSFAKAYPVEASTELATSAIQTEARKQAGLQTQSFAEQFPYILGTVAVQSLLVGGAGTAKQYYETKKTVNKVRDVFERNKDAIDKAATGDYSGINEDNEDEILFALNFAELAKVPEAKKIRESFKEYAKRKAPEVIEQINNLKEKTDNGNAEAVEKIGELTLKLQKLDAVLKANDTSILQEAVNNIMEKEPVVEPKTTEWELFGFDPTVFDEQQIIEEELKKVEEAIVEPDVVEQELKAAEEAVIAAAEEPNLEVDFDKEFEQQLVAEEQIKPEEKKQKIPEFTKESKTEDAIEFGKKNIGNKEIISELKKKEQELKKQFKNEKDTNKQIEIAHKKQLYREAREVVEGKFKESKVKSDADAIGNALDVKKEKIKNPFTESEIRKVLIESYVPENEIDAIGLVDEIKKSDIILFNDHIVLERNIMPDLAKLSVFNKGKMRPNREGEVSHEEVIFSAVAQLQNDIENKLYDVLNKKTKRKKLELESKKIAARNKFVEITKSIKEKDKKLYNLAKDRFEKRLGEVKTEKDIDELLDKVENWVGKKVSKEETGEKKKEKEEIKTFTKEDKNKKTKQLDKDIDELKKQKSGIKSLLDKTNDDIKKELKDGIVLYHGSKIDKPIEKFSEEEFGSNTYINEIYKTPAVFFTDNINAAVRYVDGIFGINLGDELTHEEWDEIDKLLEEGKISEDEYNKFISEKTDELIRRNIIERLKKVNKYVVKAKNPLIIDLTNVPSAEHTKYIAKKYGKDYLSYAKKHGYDAVVIKGISDYFPMHQLEEDFIREYFNFPYKQTIVAILDYNNVKVFEAESTSEKTSTFQDSEFDAFLNEQAKQLEKEISGENVEKDIISQETQDIEKEAIGEINNEENESDSTKLTKENPLDEDLTPILSRTIDNANKLNNLLRVISNTDKDYLNDIINDSVRLTEEEFVKKYSELIKNKPEDVKEVNLNKIYYFSKNWRPRKNRVAFVLTRNGIRLLNHEQIKDRVDSPPSEWFHTSVLDRIFSKAGFKYLYSAGSYAYVHAGLTRSGKDKFKLVAFSDWKLLQRNPNYIKDKMEAMWNAGEWVLVGRTAQGKTEVWVKNLFPGKSKEEAIRLTREKVLDKLGFGNVRDGNVLKRLQIAANTGPISNIKKYLGRKTKGIIVEESAFGFHNPHTNEFFEFDSKEEAIKKAEELGLSEDSVKPLHDGAIYVTEEYLNAYLKGLGLSAKKKAGFKSFVWQKTKDGTIALKGYFYVVAKDSPEYKLMKKHGVDMLVYEDAAKLDYPLNKVFELEDESIRFKFTDPDIHDKQTFTRTSLLFPPNDVANRYEPILKGFVNKLDVITKKLTDYNGIWSFLKRLSGYLQTKYDNDYMNIIEQKPYPHPLLIGLDGQNNPLKQQLMSLIDRAIMKMPRNGFHSIFRPSDVVTIMWGEDKGKKRKLKPGEVSIPASAYKKLRKKGFKLGDYIMVQRSPLIKPDSILMLRVVSVHGYGNQVMLSQPQYMVMTTGDFDGDEGAFIVPEKWEVEFYKSLEGKIGDISLENYKTKKEESVLNDDDLANMIARNAAGKDLIGAIANINNIYHVIANNFIEKLEVKGEDGKYILKPKYYGYDIFEYAHRIISLYHLAATDQAKFDALFNVAKKRTGINDPRAALLSELFSIYKVDKYGTEKELNKAEVANLMNNGKLFSDIQGRLAPFINMFSSFNKDFESGISWTYDNILANIKKYIDEARRNNLGRTQIEKLLINVYDKALKPYWYTNPANGNNLERKAMESAHKKAMDKLKEKYNPKALNVDQAKIQTLLKNILQVFSPKYKHNGRYIGPTTARNIALDMLNNAKLTKQEKMLFDYYVFSVIPKYEYIAGIKTFLVDDSFLKNYFELYNKFYKLERRAFANKPLSERTGIKEEPIPQNYKFKVC